jgi:hypothetical protein
MAGVLKVKDTAGTWQDIAGVGPRGAPGGPIPVGGNPGEVIVKTGPGDFEVEWQPQRPRVVFAQQVAEVYSSTVVNTFVDLISGTVEIDPTRYYQVTAGVRCIQDPGASIALAQFQVHCGVNLQGHDCVVTPDTGLWGSWSQTWVHMGNLLNGNQPDPTVVACELRGMINFASKIFYTPRLNIIEY